MAIVRRAKKLGRTFMRGIGNASGEGPSRDRGEQVIADRYGPRIPRSPTPGQPWQPKTRSERWSSWCREDVSGVGEANSRQPRSNHSRAVVIDPWIVRNCSVVRRARVDRALRTRYLRADNLPVSNRMVTASDSSVEVLAGQRVGSSGWIRTSNPPVNSRMLYH
jgi:hypothetical protein